MHARLSTGNPGYRNYDKLGKITFLQQIEQRYVYFFHVKLLIMAKMWFSPTYHNSHSLGCLWVEKYTFYPSSRACQPAILYLLINYFPVLLGQATSGRRALVREAFVLRSFTNVLRTRKPRPRLRNILFRIPVPLSSCSWFKNAC